MQFQSQARPPAGVVFDGDFGNGMDAALAFALLNGLAGKGEARLISTSTTIASLKSAAFADALARFYAGSAPVGGLGGFQRPSAPVGMAGTGNLPADASVLKAVLEKKTDDGMPAWPHAIRKLNDTADPVALIRNAMSAQADGNCIVALAGPATNLAQVMGLQGGMDLIARKVRLLVLAAGSYPDGPADPRLKADIASARRLFAEWPTPIVAAGAELGEALPFPGSAIEKDFTWTAAHPIVDAYRAFHAMPYDAPSPSLAASLYSVRSGGYFSLSAPGDITVQDDGRTRFAPSATGRRRYLLKDPAQKEKVIQAYAELVSAKPAPRPGGRGRPIQQNLGAPPLAEPPKKQ